MNWRRFSNVFIIALLRSPAHRLLSGSTVLMTIRGRRSGTRYTVPVNYVRDGDDLVIVSRRDRTWWRNLRGGAAVVVRLRGQTYTGVGRVRDDTDAVADELLLIARGNARFRRYSRIPLGADGLPTDPLTFTGLARTRVIVRVARTGPANTTPLALAGRDGNERHEAGSGLGGRS